MEGGLSSSQNHCRDELFKYRNERDFCKAFLHLLCRTEICYSKKPAQLGGKAGAGSRGLPGAPGITFPVCGEDSQNPL